VNLWKENSYTNWFKSSISSPSKQEDLLDLCVNEIQQTGMVSNNEIQ
jgi:hypothetical protein